MVAAVDVGPTTDALFYETIGRNLARTVAAHRARGAMMSLHQDIRRTTTSSPVGAAPTP